MRRPKQLCRDCGKQVAVHKDGTLWKHAPNSIQCMTTRNVGEMCPESGRNVAGQRIVQVVTTIVITDSNSERVETYTSSRMEENLRGGRDCDVLAASRALEWNRKDLARQLDRAGAPLALVPAASPPCLDDEQAH